MTLTPCQCGAVPEFESKSRYGIYSVQVVCKCGKHSASVLFSKPAERDKCVQAVADGWNLRP
jgi:hypothetical protein